VGLSKQYSESDLFEMIKKQNYGISSLMDNKDPETDDNMYMDNIIIVSEIKSNEGTFKNCTKHLCESATLCNQLLPINETGFLWALDL
jgi:hypothetical protein